MRKAMITVMMLMMFCQPVHADWFSDLKQKTQETESDDPYAMKTIEFGDFTATLAEGWLMMQEPETDGDTTTCSFANEGCSILLMYEEYELENPDLAQFLVPMFMDAFKKSKDLYGEESTELDICGRTGTMTVINYLEDGTAKTVFNTAFDTGSAVVNIMYYTESDMPFIDDYTDMIDSIEIK